MDGIDPRLKALCENVDLFHGLTPADVQKIFQKGMTERVVKGEKVFLKGTTGNKMYVVLGGKMGVYDGPKRIAVLGVGETFGEMSLLSEEPRSATVAAETDGNLFVLSEDVFHRLLTKRVAVTILLNIGKSMASKVKKTNLVIREMEGR